jgi:PBSX family phage portal protein
MSNEVQVEVIGQYEKRTDYIMKIGGQEIEVSRQIFDDQFNYDQYNCIAPVYNFDALLYFFDNNTWHSRCCRLKAAVTVGLGYAFNLIEGLEEDKNELSKLVKFFKDCNPIETFVEVMGKFALDYESLGNAYLEIIRNVKGDIVNLYHIPAQTIRVKKDRSGYVQVRDTRYVFFKNFGDQIVYNIKGEKETSVPVNERATEVLHFFQYTPRSSYYGVPEWLTSASAMLGSEKAEDFNIQFFENNAVPQFAIIVKKASLGQPTKDTIANYFKKEIKAKNHKTLVLEVPGEGDLELKELATESKDSSFRFYRLDNRDEVIASHGVPPRMVGVISAGALGGKGDSDGQKEAFLTQIIQPRQAALNHRINKIIINAGIGSQNYEFAFKELNVSDLNIDAERYDRLIKIGVYTINRVKDILHEKRYDPTKYPGADEPFIYTSSGPILLSKLMEYMEMSLAPEVPKPPGMPGGSGTTASKNSGKMKNGVQKILEEIEEIRKELANERGTSSEN